MEYPGLMIKEKGVYMSLIWKVGLWTAILGSSLLFSQEAPRIKRVPARSNSALQGHELYRAYCAVCHGTEGKGGGPAAAALRTAPSDLTQLAAKNGGRYPELRVQHLLSQEVDSVSAHGSEEMPIWGTIFRRLGPNPDLGPVRVYNLLKYLETLQAK